jgi:hypothetical protein
LQSGVENKLVVSNQGSAAKDIKDLFFSAQNIIDIHAFRQTVSYLEVLNVEEQLVQAFCEQVIRRDFGYFPSFSTRHSGSIFQNRLNEQLDGTSLMKKMELGAYSTACCWYPSYDCCSINLDCCRLKCPKFCGLKASANELEAEARGGPGGRPDRLLNFKRAM